MDHACFLPYMHSALRDDHHRHYYHHQHHHSHHHHHHRYHHQHHDINDDYDNDDDNTIITITLIKITITATAAVPAKPTFSYCAHTFASRNGRQGQKLSTGQCNRCLLLLLMTTMLRLCQQHCRGGQPEHCPGRATPAERGR